MAKKETASKRPAEAARARDRYTINLQRAFGDLVAELNRAYGQPARDEAEVRSQYAVALLAIAQFLKKVGPDYLAHFADQFAKLAQTLQDWNEGRRAPMLYPAFANRSDQTAVEECPASFRPVTATTSDLVERLLPIMNAEDNPELSAIDNQRRRYARMLWAIAKIDDDNLLPQVGTYIGDLAVALEDLIEGVTDPLFVTKGSKRDSKRTWGVRLQAALGLECLILSGLTREKAASDAARHYKALARLKRGENRDLKGSLLSWHNGYVEGRVPVPQLLEAFQTKRRELKAANLLPAKYRRLGEQAFARAVKSAIR